MKKENLVSVISLISLVMALSFSTTIPVQASPEVLMVYTPHDELITGPIMDGFNARYPGWTVEFVRAGTGIILARMEAEKENPMGDILWGGSSTLVEAYAGCFEAYESPEDAAFVRRDPAHRWHAYTTIPKAICVNTDLLKPEEHPKSIADLANPKWAGKYVYVNPRYSGTGYSIYLSVASKFGENLWIETLANCTIVGSSDAMFKAVKDGEFAVGWINEDLGIKWEAEGAPIKMIYPTDGVPWEFDTCSIIKNCPHPEAAKTFLDYIESKEAHEILATTVMRRSLRTDVAAPAGLSPTAELDFIDYDPTWAADKDARLKEFDMMIGRAATVAAARARPVDYTPIAIGAVIIVAIIAIVLVVLRRA